MLLVFVVASILVVLIYSLPKVVVSDEKESLSSKADDQEVHIHNEGDPDHESDPEQLRDLRMMISRSSPESLQPDLAIRLAEIYIDLGQNDSALWVAERLKAGGYYHEEKLVMGMSYLGMMRKSKEGEDMRRFADSSESNLLLVLNEDPADLYTKNLLAEVYLNKGEVMRSVQLLKEIVDTDANNVEAQFQLGILSIQSGQLEKGVERFEKVIENDSGNVKAMYWLAYCLVNTGSSEEAARVIELAKTKTDDAEVIAALESLSENI